MNTLGGSGTLRSICLHYCCCESKKVFLSAEAVIKTTTWPQQDVPVEHLYSFLGYLLAAAGNKARHNKGCNLVAFRLTPRLKHCVAALLPCGSWPLKPHQGPQPPRAMHVMKVRNNSIASRVQYHHARKGPQPPRAMHQAHDSAHDLDHCKDTPS